MRSRGLSLAVHGNGAQQLEGAALEGCGLGERLEGRQRRLGGQPACVAAQGGEIVEQSREAAQWQALGGLARGLLGACRGRTRGGSPWRQQARWVLRRRGSA